MPRTPEWFSQVHQIMQELHACEAPVLDRASVENLFRVRRRRALQLMLDFGAQRCGKALILERRALLSQLRRLSEEPGYRQEWRRRSKLGSRVQQLHQLWQARSVRLERPPAASHGASLPRGVELHPGSLQITFETPAGLLQTLYGLATQAARDWSVFENLISSSLPLVK